MKKPIIILLTIIMIIMLSGCKMGNSVSDQDVEQEASKEADISTEEGEGTETKEEETEEVTDGAAEIEDTVSLQPGFEDWEDSEAIRALNQVLTMNAAVKITTAPSDSAGAGEFKDYYLNDITHFLDYEFDQKMVPDQYAIVDLDHDGTPEVVVSLLVNYDGWILVMRYYEGNVYGYSFQLRGFEMPRTDGTYLASSGASDSSIMELSFDGYNIKENTLAYTSTASGELEYFVADNKVSEEEYNNFSQNYYNCDEVKWNLFPSDFRAGYEGEELYHVDFNAVTKPVVNDMESYYSGRESESTFSYSSRIPEALCDLIIEAMKSGNEEETFSPLVVGTEISQVEYCSQTGFEAQETEYVFPVVVDADNDGIPDVVGQYYGGGTGGFSTMELYQGLEAGGYQRTSSMDCFLQDYDFISYQGKNYLLMKEINYNTKYYSGYTLYLYEDGILADGKSFSFDIEDYEMEIAYEDTVFSGMEQIKSTLGNKELSDILENNDGVIYGNAETIDKNNSSGYEYSCDIDNDGTMEHYYKYMWYPSNMGTVMGCAFDFENSDVLEDLCRRLEEKVGEGRLYTFWIDQVEDKNIIYLYYGENMDYSLYAYLLTGEE